MLSSRARQVPRHHGRSPGRGEGIDGAQHGGGRDVADVGVYLSACAQLVKPGATIVATPNKTLVAGACPQPNIKGLDAAAPMTEPFSPGATN